MSENCSSPNDHQYDDFRPGFKDNENEEESVRSSFQMSNDSAFYHKTSNNLKETSNSYNNEYSEISKRIMRGMGHKPGKGLGKFEHGRVEPVEASTQKGRRGLGLKPSIVGEVPQNFKWSPDESTPEAKEEVVSRFFFHIIYIQLKLLFQLWASYVHKNYWDMLFCFLTK